jgi:hypothetical protein
MEDREDADPYANAANPASTIRTAETVAEPVAQDSPTAPTAADGMHDGPPAARAAAARGFAEALDRQAAEVEKERKRNRPSWWERLKQRWSGE